MVKNLPANVEDMGSIPELGRSLGEGSSKLLQDSCLENHMDRGALQAIVHGVTKSMTWLSVHIHIYYGAFRLFPYLGYCEECCNETHE